MKPFDFNLARRPFVNVRPVRRAALLFCLLGGLLAVANGVLYWRHFSGRSQQSAQLEDIDDRIEAEKTAVARLERELAAIDLEWQNQQVVFLNSKIDERTFSWSTLFDRLAEVMPLDLQLRRVTPRIRQAENPRRRRALLEPSQSGVVHIEIAGSVRSGEALLEFLDSLFAHPSFRDPNLVNEARQSELTDFSLTVVYLPPPSSAEESAAAGESAEATIGTPTGSGGVAQDAEASDPMAPGRTG